MLVFAGVDDMSYANEERMQMHQEEVETKKYKAYIEITNNQIDEVLASMMSLARQSTGRSLSPTQRHYTNNTIQSDFSGLEKLLADSQDRLSTANSVADEAALRARMIELMRELGP